MHKRLQRALRLNRRVTQLATTTTQAGAAQPAWTITRLITAQSLDYDFRVLPLALTKPAAEILKAALLTSMTAATGTARLTGEQETHAFLPTQYAGLQLQCPETTAPLARAAHLIENGHHIRDAIKRWADQGLTAASPERYDGVEGTDFHALASALYRLNHAFDPNGLPAVWVRPLQPQDLRIPAPSQHILSAANRAVSARRYAELLDRPWCPEMDGADEPEPYISDGETNAAPRGRSHGEQQTENSREPDAQTARSVYDNATGRQCERSLHSIDQDAVALAHDPTAARARPTEQRPTTERPPTTSEPWRRRCVRLRSAGGPTAGRLWTAQAGAPGTNLTDAEWRTATRYRLGIPLGPGTYHCQNRATDPRVGNDSAGSDAMPYAAHMDHSAIPTTTNWQTWSRECRRKREQRSRAKHRFESSRPTDQPSWTSQHSAQPKL